MSDRETQPKAAETDVLEFIKRVAQLQTGKYPEDAETLNGLIQEARRILAKSEGK